MADQPQEPTSTQSTQLRTLRLRYIGAIALLLAAWVLWAYGAHGGQALSIAVEGNGRHDFLRGAVISLTLMLAGWAVLPGSAARRTVAASIMAIYMALMIFWTNIATPSPLVGATIVLLLTAIMPVLFLAAWLIVRRASLRSYLTLLPVAALALVWFFTSERTDVFVPYSDATFVRVGDWVLIVRISVFGLLINAVMIGMAWWARTLPLRALVPSARRADAVGQ